MSIFPRHDTHHLKHTPDLISMQQYANGLDLLVSVSFISPGFFSLPLSFQAVLSLTPSLSPVFPLLATSTHTHTDKLGELIYSRMCHSRPCVPLSVCFCRCVHHIDLLSLREHGPLMSTHSLVERAALLRLLFHFWYFRHGKRERNRY